MSLTSNNALSPKIVFPPPSSRSKLAQLPDLDIDREYSRALKEAEKDFPSDAESLGRSQQCRRLEEVIQAAMQVCIPFRSWVVMFLGSRDALEAIFYL